MRISSLIPLALLATLASPVYAGDHKITMANWTFSPTTLTVTAGERITWFNDDDSHHNVVFEAPDMPGSPNIKPEKEYSAVFDKPGEYKYYCKYHRDHGMTGTVVVKPAAK